MSGIEVASLVLGGIPLAIAALEHYRNYIRPLKNFVHYERVLKQLKIDLFLQRKQLELSLQSSGFRNFSAPPAELHRHLRHVFPQDYEMLAQVIEGMEKTIDHLMQDLDIDRQGKPLWTSSTTGSRTSWEWRRVKRAFTRERRKELIRDLQYYNDALERCTRKPTPRSELHGSDIIQKIQSTFSSTECSLAREEAHATHDALEGGLRCSGDHLHESQVQLNTCGAMAPVRIFNVIFSVPNRRSTRSLPSTQDWIETQVRVQNEPEDEPSSAGQTTNGTPMEPRGPSSRKRARGNDYSGSADASQAPKKIKRKRLPWSTRTAQIRGHAFFASANASQSNPTNTLSSSHIDCLCRALRFLGIGETNIGSLPVQGRNPKRRITINASPLGSSQSEKLSSFFDRSNLRSLDALSRAHRLGIAAAMASTVLHFCGSPWLDKLFNKDDVIIAIHRRDSPKSVLPRDVYIRSALRSQHHSNATPISQAEQFGRNQIRHLAIFSLGILLIELALNRTMSELHSDFRNRPTDSNTTIDSSAAPSPSTNIMDDYTLANKHLLNHVYLEAGDDYGYATQRCIGFEFRGRDATKTFDNEQFCQHFFNDVVAPLQATYERTEAALSIT